jgi:hypothetical protein
VTATGLYTAEEIYRLLPSVYRVRDGEQGEPLRELLELIAEQVNVLAESMEQLYDDQFVETCAPWAAAYIGELIGYRSLHGVLPDIASPRAEVANTIRYRRRKGTVPVLEQLALDVTGWPARAVEFFELLAATQFMNHIRLHAKATADLRDEGLLELAGSFQAGAFDGFAHTAEMRRIPTRAGRYNIQNLGLFLWRVNGFRLVRSPLVDADDPAQGLRYRFDALGTDKPLFNARRTEQEITHIAEPIDLPVPLPRRFAKAHLRDLYGTGRAFLLESEAAGVADPIAEVRICDLSDDPATPGAWIHQPQAGDTHVAVDPVLGRVAFAAAAPAGEQRLVTFHYGSALAIGGGGYDRASSLERMNTVLTVSGGAALAGPLGSAKNGGAVQILDSRRYAAPATITANTPPATGDRVVALRSSNRARPLLTRDDQLKLALQPDATVVLDGLVLAGGPLVIEESADTEQRKLVLRHCTLVPGVTREPDGDPHFPGRASLIVLHPFAEVKLEHCVVGPIVAVEGVEVEASNSVIDASGEHEVAYCGRDGSGTVTIAADRQTGDGLEPGGHLTLDSCTVVGKVHAQRLDVSDSILMARLGDPDPWPAPVWAERRQVGCLRFTFVPPGSRTPRRFHCAGADPSHRPSHTSLRYGDPGYMQLRRSTHPAVRTGASDEGSMGVTHELHEPQREANLRIRLDEFLRYGLEAGIFYAT